jgi:Zn-dependent M28 family amino/carboxypeptidase
MCGEFTQRVPLVSNDRNDFLLARRAESANHPAGMKGSRSLFLICAVAAVLTGGQACRSTSSRPSSRSPISAENLLRHIRVLASDEFEGRAPASRSEELTVAYLTNTFQKLGLTPAGPNGSFVQRVPLVGSTASEVEVAFAHGSGVRSALTFPAETVVWTKRIVPEIKVEQSEMVFVGYGVVAPEYQWDDYKDADLRGKTIVMLVNDPPVPDPQNPDRLDDRVFNGRAMTYYGRWTYKYEVAAEKGAAGALVIHETGPAGYPWAVVEGSNSRENFDLQTSDRNMGRAPVEGWIAQDKARELLAASGLDFDQLKRAAASREFRPVPLKSKASFKFRNTTREVISQNVLAKVEGTDRKLKDEYIIFTAHWDHLGRDTSLQYDQVFNGARDNASGVASLLELGRLFAQSKPRRTMIFLAVTAEEKGLLGAKHYAREPVYPLKQTLANINMDSMNPWGRTLDLTVIGLGQTTIEDVLRDVAKAKNRTLIADAEPEKGRYYRSDHFEFAKVGVPGLYTHSGTNFIGRDPSFGTRKIAEYVAHDYHKVSDEIKPDWDLSGAAEDTELLFEVGSSIANSSRWPAWKEGSEFRKLRK